MKALDPLGGEPQCRDRFGRRRGGALGDLARRQPQSGGGEVDPVEAAGVVDQRRVAAAGDVLDDRRDRGIDVGGDLALGVDSRANAASKPGSRVESLTGIGRCLGRPRRGSARSSRRPPSGRVFSAGRLTISRELTSAMRSISTNPFAFKVAPV